MRPTTLRTLKDLYEAIKEHQKYVDSWFSTEFDREHCSCCSLRFAQEQARRELENLGIIRPCWVCGRPATHENEGLAGKLVPSGRYTCDEHATDIDDRPLGGPLS